MFALDITDKNNKSARTGSGSETLIGKYRSFATRTPIPKTASFLQIFPTGMVRNGRFFNQHGMELKLSLDDFDIAPEEIRVFSIQAPNISPFRLVHFLNKSEYWDFYNTCCDFCPENRPETSFEIFRFDNEVDHVQWFFLGNPLNRTPWIESLPQTDFFLLAIGSGAEFLETEPVFSILGGIPEIFLYEALGMPPHRASARKNSYFEHFKEFYHFLCMHEMIESWE